MLLGGRQPVPQFALFGPINPLEFIVSESAHGHFNPNSTLLTDPLFGIGHRKRFHVPPQRAPLLAGSRAAFTFPNGSREQEAK